MAESEYDFKKNTETKINLSDYLKQKEKEIQEKIDKPKAQPSQKSNQNGASWSLLAVVFLVFCLVGLGLYSVATIKEKETEISQARDQAGQVAGVNEDKEDTSSRIKPISAEGFSIAPAKVSPTQDFKQSSTNQDSPFLEDRSSTVTKYLATIQNDGKELKSGIEIYVTEYDNRHSQAEFDQLVATSLGSDYEVISSRDIQVQDHKLTKIKKSPDTEKINYYTTVTTDNYYVIKIYKETEGLDKYEEINNFTNSILDNLYLN